MHNAMTLVALVLHAAAFNISNSVLNWLYQLSIRALRFALYMRPF